MKEFLQAARDEDTHVYQMLLNIPSEWAKRFNRKPEPEALIFHLNLLENAAHKVLKSRIAYSSKLHPSVHYLFSKISEMMLYQSVYERQREETICNWKDTVILFNEWIIRS